MIKIVPAEKRHFENAGWLKTFWLFSFDNYYDPDNMEWGALRVFNDDVISPKSGFPPHNHRDMDIITLVHDGELTHEDSLGNKYSIGAGEIQRMSAGTGITHSEWNHGANPVHLYQIWFYPKRSGLDPKYDQRNFSFTENGLILFSEGLNSNSKIFGGHLKNGTIKYEADPKKHILIYVMEGRMLLGSSEIKMQDQARIAGEANLTFRSDNAKFILIESE